MTRFKNFTVREKWFAGAAAFFAVLFGGAIAANLLAGPALQWEGVSAAIAMLALPLALLGYFDNKNAQQLEHRAYIRVALESAIYEASGCLKIKLCFTNYGRTPARAISAVCKASPHLGNTKEAYFDLASLHPGAPISAFETTHGGFHVDYHKWIADPSSHPTFLFIVSMSYHDAFGIERTEESMFDCNQVQFDGSVWFMSPHLMG